MTKYNVYYCGEYMDTIDAKNKEEAINKVMQKPFFEAEEVKK